MTCLNEAGVCPGEAVIAIADACPEAYMNEASNSWVLDGAVRRAHRPLRGLLTTCSRWPAQL